MGFSECHPSAGVQRLSITGPLNRFYYICFDFSNSQTLSVLLLRMFCFDSIVTVPRQCGAKLGKVVVQLVFERRVCLKRQTAQFVCSGYSELLAAISDVNGRSPSGIDVGKCVKKKASENETYNATEIKVTGAQTITRISRLLACGTLLGRNRTELASHKKVYFRNGRTPLE